MTPKEALVAARQLIADPKNFCQGTYALDAGGCAAGWSSDDAVAFCAVGAVYKVTRSWTPDDALDLLNKAAGAAFTSSLVNVNDLLGHASVLKMFDLAIQAAE